MEKDELEKLKKFADELREEKEYLRKEVNRSLDTLKRIDETLREIASDLRGSLKDLPKSSSLERAARPQSDPIQNSDLMSTGIGKLDDLILGGLRPSSNVLLYGPPFSGKLVLSYNFIARSIEDMVPVVVVSTDKDINQIKYEVGRITDLVDEAEKNGMLKFVDAYSRAIQIEPPSEYASVVDGANISSLIKSVDAITAEFKTKHPYYRLVFSSLTSYISQNTEDRHMRFIQQFVQKRRAEKAVSLYILEEGIFESNTYESLSYLMDGAIEFRITGNGNRLRVKGLSSARTRDWVEMYPDETGFDLGSFTLERIR